MRFKCNIPKYGAKRTITKFAIFPITIGCETRWLEKVTIKQRFIRWSMADEWDNVKFKN